MTSVLQSQHEHYAEVRARLYGGRYAARAATLGKVAEVAAPSPRKPRQKVKAAGTVEATLPPSSWKPIAIEVCERRGLALEDVTSSSRLNDLVIARHEIWARMRDELSWSYPRIGRAFGDFDHSSVISGIRAHAERQKQTGQPRVWKGKEVAGYVSQIAAVMDLLGKGHDRDAICRLAGLNKGQVCRVLSEIKTRQLVVHHG